MQTNKTLSKISGYMKELFHSMEKLTRKIFTPVVLFLLILVLGIFARVSGFPNLPPGIKQDEAIIGIEAYDLLHFGVDRNGVSYPVNFVSWGDGMDALYGYVLIPFVAFGLTPLTVRLPSLLAGILTLPLVYFIGKRSLGETFGLLSMFLLAISPWNILMSRWGLNETILPFVFSLGFACILLSTPKNGWFIAAAAIFGLSLYSYGATYVALPVFLVCAIPILVAANRLSRRNLIIGLVVFTALLIPILLFVLVNAFGWDSIHIGPFTVPRLATGSRLLNTSATSFANPFITMLDNIRSMVKLLLVYQSDRHVWNTVEPFGYMYSFSFILAVMGAILLFPSQEAKNKPERLLILAWLLASLCIGLFQFPNFNRIYLVFIPITLCAAFFLTWMGERSKASLAAIVLVYLTSFYVFNNIYHAAPYLDQAKQAFHPGLLPALKDARQSGDQPICVTDQIFAPFIYVVFDEKMSPDEFQKQAVLKDPTNRAGEVISLGRYTFGRDKCTDPAAVYVLKSYEPPPDNGITYQVKEYDDFRAYYP
jgi:hypothetical protein